MRYVNRSCMPTISIIRANALLFTGAYVCGVFAIDFGGILYPWKSGRVISLFVLCGLLFIGFGFQQGLKFLTTEENRIFPVHFLKSRTLIMLFAATACGSTATFLPIYFIPLFFQFTRNDSALEAGIRLLPFVVFLVVFCVANGAIMSATGYYMPWFLFGGVITVIGNALLFTVDEHSSIARVYGYSILAGTGAGAFVQAGFSVAQGKVDFMDIPLAIGFITAGQIGGSTISLAIANSVFLNGATTDIGALLPDQPKAAIQSAVAGASAGLFESLNEDMRDAVTAAIVDNMKYVYVLAVTAGALLVIMSVFMKREKLFLKAGAAG